LSSLSEAFPNLHPDNFHVTSYPSAAYNCIAWAAEDTSAWWWHAPEVRGFYWPPGVSHVLVLASFIQLFESLGYHECSSEEMELETEKVALYADIDGTPTHAARQLASGRWTSKLGQHIDIEHATLAALEGGVYGSVARILSRLSARTEEER